MKTDCWLSMSKSGNAVRFNDGFSWLYAPVDRVFDLLEGKIRCLRFSKLDNGEFLQTDYKLEFEDYVLKLQYGSKELSIRKENFFRLIRRDIKGTPFYID